MGCRFANRERLAVIGRIEVDEGVDTASCEETLPRARRIGPLDRAVQEAVDGHGVHGLVVQERLAGPSRQGVPRLLLGIAYREGIAVRELLMQLLHDFQVMDQRAYFRRAPKGHLHPFVHIEGAAEVVGVHPDLVSLGCPLTQEDAVDHALGISLRQEVHPIESIPGQVGGIGEAAHEVFRLALEPRVDCGLHVEVEAVQVVEAADGERLLEVDPDPIRGLARGRDTVVAGRSRGRRKREWDGSDTLREPGIEDPLARQKGGVPVGAPFQSGPVLGEIAARRPDGAKESQDMLQGARPLGDCFAAADPAHRSRWVLSEPYREPLVQTEHLAVGGRGSERNAVQIVEDDVLSFLAGVGAFLVDAQARREHLPELVDR